MKRGTPIKRTARVKTVNRARKDREWSRVYGSHERVRWVVRQPCLVTHCRATPSQNCHIASGGAGRKADHTSIAPLCHGHHAEQHATGIKTFAARYGLDLPAEAAETHRRWLAYLDREARDGE